MLYSSLLFSRNHFIDLLQISGDWYSILLASDFKGKIEENGSFRISMEHISACDNSSLALKLYTK